MVPVSGAAEEFRQQRTEGFDGILGRFAAGDFRRVSLQFSDEFIRFRIEVSRHVAFHTTSEFSSFLREGFLISREFLIPCRLFRPASFFRIPLGVDFRRDFERRVFPAQLFAGQRDFRVAQRRAVESWVPCLFGEPKPMMVLHISRDGLSVTARASSVARLIASAS